VRLKSFLAALILKATTFVFAAVVGNIASATGEIFALYNTRVEILL
jgi:hypothetical protein